MKTRIFSRMVVAWMLAETLRLFVYAQTVGVPPVSGQTGDRPGTITFGELPSAVQITIRGQAGSAEIDRIATVVTNGQTRYDVAFKRAGQPMELRIDPAGHLLNGTQTQTSSPKRAPLSAATKVSFAELPPEVQNALHTHTPGMAVENIVKGTLQGKTVYEAAFKQDGKSIGLRFAQDGTMIHDDVDDQYLAQRNHLSDQSAANGVGRAPGSQNATRGEASGARELDEPKPITFGELPFPVLSTLQTQAGAVAIEGLSKGSVSGSTVYEATFHREGKIVQLRIAPDGKILSSQTESPSPK